MAGSLGCGRRLRLWLVQENFGMCQLHGRRNAPLLPVVDALNAALLVEAQQFSNLGGAAKAINEFTVHSN